MWHAYSIHRVGLREAFDKDIFVTQTLPAGVTTEMARRRERSHYYLWHGLRNSWPRLTESGRRAVHAINPGWVPPRPALDAGRRPVGDNDSGEDFLFMHRRMIERVNDMLLSQNHSGGERVRGWVRVPPPDDEEYPVPEFPDSGLEEVKSEEYYHQHLAPLERRYTDMNYLRSVTLGQLGSDIEFNFQVGAHLRWAAPSAVGYRPTFSTGNVIEERWDDPAYNYLGDMYSCHVNPIFWKLHGWIDDRVEDWRRAHGIVGNIVWKGTWVGPPVESGLRHQEVFAGRDVGEELRRAALVISVPGAAGFDGFFRPETCAL